MSIVEIPATANLFIRDSSMGPSLNIAGTGSSKSFTGVGCVLATQTPRC